MATLTLNLQTRVGRRIVALFVLSALLPIVALSILGYVQVRDQLLEQAQTQLSQSAKSVGMGVFDQLRIARSLLERGDSAGHMDIASRIEPAGRGSAPALQLIAEPAGGDAAVWLAVQGGARRARLRPEYLFQGAHDRAAVGSADIAVCVHDSGTGRQLYCEGEEAGDSRVTASWDLFLAFDYGVPPWRIAVAMPRSSVLAPVLAFRRTLLATLVLVLGLVVALSSVQVRRSLEPLRALNDGTRRLAAHDFSQPVAVRSGDEFQELADSFNRMASDLNGQFQDNARLITRLNDLSWGALAALARTVDASSPWTAGHSERVTSLSLRMAARLGLDQAERDTLHRGGLLHDIGKIGIAPEILDKPGTLLPHELARIREHPALGAKILAPLSAFADAIPIVQFHHERYDGNGYPSGLIATNIPKLARLLAVADVYDALVSDRPYRPGWTHQAATSEIHASSGTQFDPAMVAVFEQIMAEEGDAARFTLAEVPA